jgi:hypothetical protein
VHGLRPALRLILVVECVVLNFDVIWFAEDSTRPSSLPVIKHLDSNPQLHVLMKTEVTTGDTAKRGGPEAASALNIGVKR